jgi:RNA polymerase sigma-70 factor (ECF subfamily)
MNSDEALMLDFQRGSRAAFEELYARYRGPLYGFFRRRLTQPERAEDLTQETFLAVIRATSRYEPRSLVRTYLYGIALNLLAAARRKQARDKDAPIPESMDEPRSQDVPETSLWVRQALDRLEAGDREVLMLREYEQLSYSEIAQVLRIPVNTLRSRLFRARMALKENLQPEAEAQANAQTKARSAVVAIRTEKRVSANPAESEA